MNQTIGYTIQNYGGINYVYTCQYFRDFFLQRWLPRSNDYSEKLTKHRWDLGMGIRNHLFDSKLLVNEFVECFFQS